MIRCLFSWWNQDESLNGNININFKNGMTDLYGYVVNQHPAILTELAYT